METVILSNGLEMPKLGLGTYLLEKEVAYSVVEEAIKVGYRHIDTAAYYKNEEEVGKVVKDSGLPRDAFFITTKLWNDDQGYDATLAAFETSLNNLGMDYVDLYLIHWPQEQSKESWRALEEIYKSGRARAIGVSNFNVGHMKKILEVATIIPMVNQIERHPLHQQVENREFADAHNIRVEGWMPILRNRLNDNEMIMKLSEKYGKTPAQIILRWHTQEDWTVFPKTQTFSRLRENIDIFDFKLTQEEITAINALDEKETQTVNPDKYTIL